MTNREEKPYTLTVKFRTLEDVINFASVIAPTGISVYQGDALDHEFSSAVPTNSLVLRKDGHKPDQMRIA